MSEEPCPRSALSAFTHALSDVLASGIISALISADAFGASTASATGSSSDSEANARVAPWVSAALLTLSINASEAPASLLFWCVNCCILGSFLACLPWFRMLMLRVLKRCPYNGSALLRFADGSSCPEADGRLRDSPLTLASRKRRESFLVRSSCDEELRSRLGGARDYGFMTPR